MDWDAAFRLCNGAALASWVALVALPRWAVVRGAILGLVIGSLCVLYGALVMTYLFRVEGGGFFSLGAVQVLFTSRPVALAGWVHYLAFDLLIGLWIARRFDRIGLSRLLQAPLLVTIFMFGPLGLLLSGAVLAGWPRRALAAE